MSATATRKHTEVTPERAEPTPEQAAVILAAMEKELGGMTLVPDDFPRAWTRRQEGVYTSRQRELQLRIPQVRLWMPKVASLARGEVDATTDLNEFTKVWNTLAEEFQALGANNPKQYNVRLSLMMLERGRPAIEDTGYVLDTLRLGQLIRERGIVWHGCLPELEERLANVKKDLAHARLMLTDACAVSERPAELATV